MREKPKSRPCHTSTLHEPCGRVTHFVSRPTGRFKGRGYCKYCYRTHGQWWQMNEAAYGAGVVLCGYCEYTSLKEIVFG